MTEKFKQTIVWEVDNREVTKALKTLEKQTPDAVKKGLKDTEGQATKTGRAADFLRSHWGKLMVAGAALGAVIGGLKKAYDLAAAGAAHLAQEQALALRGTDPKDVRAFQKLLKGTVDQATVLRSTLRLSFAGLNRKEMARFYKGVEAGAKLLGQTREAILGMAESGGITEEAWRSVGMSTEEATSAIVSYEVRQGGLVTQQERLRISMLLYADAATKALAKAGTAVKDHTGSYENLAASATDFTKAVGRGFARWVTPALDGATKKLTFFQKWIGLSKITPAGLILRRFAKMGAAREAAGPFRRPGGEARPVPGRPSPGITAEENRRRIERMKALRQMLRLEAAEEQKGRLAAGRAMLRNYRETMLGLRAQVSGTYGFIFAALARVEVLEKTWGESIDANARKRQIVLKTLEAAHDPLTDAIRSMSRLTKLAAVRAEADKVRKAQLEAEQVRLRVNLELNQRIAHWKDAAAGTEEQVAKTVSVTILRGLEVLLAKQRENLRLLKEQRRIRLEAADLMVRMAQIERARELGKVGLEAEKQRAAITRQIVQAHAKLAKMQGRRPTPGAAERMQIAFRLQALDLQRKQLDLEQEHLFNLALAGKANAAEMAQLGELTIVLERLGALRGMLIRQQKGMAQDEVIARRTRESMKAIAQELGGLSQKGVADALTAIFAAMGKGESVGNALEGVLASLVTTMGQTLIAWGTTAVFGALLSALGLETGVSAGGAAAGAAAIAVGAAMVAGGSAWGKSAGAGTTATSAAGGGGAPPMQTAPPRQAPQQRVLIVNFEEMLSDEPQSRKVGRFVRTMEREGYSVRRRGG